MLEYRKMQPQPAHRQKRRWTRWFHSFWAYFKVECLLYLREPIGMFFTIFFPLLLLFLFGVLFGGVAIPGSDYGLAQEEVRFIDTYLPSLFVLIMANIGIMNIPITLANYKELKILRQYHTVPAPFSSYLLGFAFVQVLMFVVSCAVVVGAAAIVFGITLPPNFVGIAWMTLLSLTAVYSLGFALGSLFSSVRTAQPVATAIFFILFFLSGAAIPRSQFPEWLQNVTAFVPLAQIVDAYAWAWLGRPNALSLPFYLSVLTIFTVSMLILVRSLKRQ